MNIHNSPIDSSVPPSSISSASTKIKSENGKPSRFSQWTTDWITDWWGLEIICWILSAISVASIVIVLETHKNKTVPKWPLKITINSLISIFATIGQMAMMKPVVECISQLKWLWFVRKERLVDFGIFDNASRGPTGSLMLLGKLRGLHLVTIGAAIAVCSTAFGAFAQQVVTYPLHPHASGNATTPLVFNLTGEFQSAFEISLEQAIYTGLASNGSTPLGITPFCETGNCTWTEYSSLGICPTVVDLSSMILTHACDPAALDKFFQEAGLENPGFPCFDYTLPYVGYEDISYTNNDTQTYWPQNTTLTNVALPSNHPWAVQFMTITQCINSSLSSPIAYSFSLNLCVQTYHTAVSKGGASTAIVSSQPFYPNMTMTDTLSAFEIYGNSTAMISVGGVDFGITNQAISFLLQGLEDVMSDDCYLIFNKTQAASSANGDIYCDDLFGTAYTGLLGSDLNSTSPFVATELLAQNIATSLTNSFLFGAGGNAQIMQFQGMAFSPEAFVATEYEWLIFPLALVSLTFIFLVATISKSQRLGSKVWKSSTQAMLQGLHIDLHTQLGGLSSISEMEEKTKLIKVRFDGDGSKAEHEVEYRLVESKREEEWKG